MSISPSFDLLASVTASTKRSPAIVDGKIGDPEAHLPGVKIYPLAPLDDQVRVMLNLTAVVAELWQTFTLETDIREGDVLTVSSKDYHIKAVGDWPWRPSGADRVVIAVEEAKTS